MRPKEKAKELVQKFRIHQPVWEVEGDAKQCALIAVDEILHFMIDNLKWDEKTNGNIDYWQEVKQEIQAL